jgi:hypothetical protein
MVSGTKTACGVRSSSVRRSRKVSSVQGVPLAADGIERRQLLLERYGGVVSGLNDAQVHEVQTLTSK